MRHPNTSTNEAMEAARRGEALAPRRWLQKRLKTGRYTAKAVRLDGGKFLIELRYARDCGRLKPEGGYAGQTKAIDEKYLPLFSESI